MGVIFFFRKISSLLRQQTELIADKGGVVEVTVTKLSNSDKKIFYSTINFNTIGFLRNSKHIGFD